MVIERLRVERSGNYQGGLIEEGTGVKDEDAFGNRHWVGNQGGVRGEFQWIELTNPLNSFGAC